MSEQQPSGDGSFSDEIYSGVPTHSSPAILKEDFKPWHKPRKQWVRKFQWLHEIESLTQHLRLIGERPFRYLSLPGKDLLDVRCVNGWCQQRGINLKFLGYNDPFDPADLSDSELNHSVAELTQRASVDRDSQVVADKFEAIGNCDSVAYRRMVEAGPFDVINLDLCNSVVGHVPLAKQADYYKAIYELVAFQKKNRTEPWLLFITTRSNQGSVNHEAGWLLFDCIKKNAEEHESFKSRLMSDLGFKYQEATRPATGVAPYHGMSYRNLVSLGLGKWLLCLLVSGQPRWCLSMLDSAEYRVRHPRNSPDMLSLAFRCSLIIEPPIDIVGFAKAPAQGAAVPSSEEELALGLIGAVKGIQDLDAIMANVPLKKALIEEATQLMIDAHYNGVKFKAWAEGF